MRLYHGSKSGIEGPIKPIGSSVNDFGRGFYLGDEPSQPLSLICRGAKPTFYTCELDLAGLRVHRFPDGLDWVLFVAWNRDMIPEEFRSAYDGRFQSLRAENDVLVGRIANDRMFIVLDMFFKNTLSDTALVDCLKALNLGNQYCAVTDAACARVKVVDSRVLSGAECEIQREKSRRQRQRAIDEVERIRLRHLHDGLFFQEILEREALFWAGFIYRFWSFKTGEQSRAIYARFPLADVLSVYPGFHTISNDRAVEEMIAIAERRAA